MASHESVAVSARHPIHGIEEFADNTARDAHTYDDGDVGKVVKVLSPLAYYLITAQSGGTGTFVDISAAGGLVAHDLGGTYHNADTLANLNSKISDATLDDSSASRPPSGSASGDLSGTYPSPTVNDGADSTAIHDNVSSEISAITEKASPVSADLILIEDSEASNAKKKVQIANLPGGGLTSHAIGGSYHTASTLAELNTKISDATLDDSSDPRTDPDAIHDNVAAEISAVTEKASPVSADLLLIEDSEASNVKKRVQIGNLPGGTTDTDAIHVNAASEISGITEKASPVSGDLIVIEDSAASNVKKKVQIGNLPSSGISAVVDDTTPELGGDLECNNRKVYEAKTITFNSEYDNGTKTSSFALDFSIAQKQRVTLGASVLLIGLTFPGPGNYLLSIRQDATGGRVLTWLSSIKAPGSKATGLVLSTDANAIDIVSFYYDGSSIFATIANNFGY